ncbi:MAG: AbrB family transcriptional regulator [Actinomycetota bacterium]|nr:AbrB family transcriptional regulator [Actinomycetota bacterium]
MSETAGGEEPPGRRLPAGVPALGGGLAGATVLVLLQVPAGGIVGAVAGSAMASGLRGHRPPPRAVRVVGMVLLGCAAGVRLDPETLRTLLRLALPLLAAVTALLVLDVALAVVLHRRYGVDPLTALLACAPGGVSEISVLAQDTNARTGIVIAVHVVRVVTVVLVALPLLVALLGQP